MSFPNGNTSRCKNLVNGSNEKNFYLEQTLPPLVEIEESLDGDFGYDTRTEDETDDDETTSSNFEKSSFHSQGSLLRRDKDLAELDEELLNFVYLSSLKSQSWNEDKVSTITKPTNITYIVKEDNGTITKKPSSTSKGFENTFKLLQNQVENTNEKAVSIMKTIKSDHKINSKTNLHMSLSHMELEHEAIERLRSMLVYYRAELKYMENQNAEQGCDLLISTSVFNLLYKFVVKIFTGKDLFNEEDKTCIVKILSEDEENDDVGIGGGAHFMYHAYIGGNGKKCLRIIRKSLNKTTVLCGNRVSQMTRAYDDIEAVTRLLEEKEKDLELTVQIGKELLSQNNILENRVSGLEVDLKVAADDRAQLLHELHKKNELIAVLTNDGDDGSENDTPTFSKSITLDLLQKKITTLQDENRSLKSEASQLAYQTDAVEEQERQLMADITAQLNETNGQFDNLNLELERQREENRLQHEQIVSLTARLGEAEMRLHQLTHDNDEHVTLLNITKENQNSLALELVEFKQRYQEVLALLQEAQEQLRKQRKKQMPQARSSFLSMSSIGGGCLLQPDSLQSELMESSMYSESSLDSGISGDAHRTNDRISRLMSQLQVSGGNNMSTSIGAIGASGIVSGPSGAQALPPYKRIFETVRCVSRNGNYLDSSTTSMTQLGTMSMSSSSGTRMSTSFGNSQPAGSYYHNSVYEDAAMGGIGAMSESFTSQPEDGYPEQPSGVPGAPGAKDLEAALNRLTPAEVLARRAMLSYAPAGTYSYDDPIPSQLPLGVRTPDSIMSTGSSGRSSSSNMSWRLPEKLQIVKPMEGSQTLHHWSQLATPTLSGLLDERPGVTIRGGRNLEDLGMQVYTLSDVEEDVSDDLPGKQFDATGCTYTFSTSIVLHPDDGLLTDLSFLSQSQLSSRMASTSTSRQPSCPPTPRSGLSRKNSCSTFSVNLGLASMLNERGIKAVTPSALNTPAGPNFSPTVTPCNSPEGSPTRSRSPEPLFGLLSSGADLIRRKLIGVDIERPNRNQQKQQQKIMLSRLERRALRSLKLVEKVESIGLENIISTQPCAMSQLASGIANRSSSPMAQLTSLKHMHTNANQIVDDIHFDREQIKGVLNKGLTSPSSFTATLNIPSNDICDDRIGTCASEYKQIGSTSTPISTTIEPLMEQLQQPSSSAQTRVKQMQRQKSRRNLKNGLAAQRQDLGTIGGNGRVRDDLGKVATQNTTNSNSFSDKKRNNTMKTEPGGVDIHHEEVTQSITQSFVGTVSSLLFGRKGGWL